MELSSFFGRREGSRGFQGVLGASGSFQGQFRVRKKIKSGLNRHLRQPFAAISSRIDSPGSPGASGMPPGHFWQKKHKIVILGPGPPWGPMGAPAALRDLREAHCTLVVMCGKLYSATCLRDATHS